MRLNGPLPSDLSEPGFRALLCCAHTTQKILKIIKDLVILFIDVFSLKFYKELFTYL
tara:strand:+ start:160 stop:330 length:171 start_codon:yes stop_codon:yes gene_type:complete